MLLCETVDYAQRRHVFDESEPDQFPRSLVGLGAFGTHHVVRKATINTKKTRVAVLCPLKRKAAPGTCSSLLERTRAATVSQRADEPTTRGERGLGK
jgi:hypothetical protein